MKTFAEDTSDAHCSDVTSTMLPEHSNGCVISNVESTPPSPSLSGSDRDSDGYTVFHSEVKRIPMCSKSSPSAEKLSTDCANITVGPTPSSPPLHDSNSTTDQQVSSSARVLATSERPPREPSQQEFVNKLAPNNSKLCPVDTSTNEFNYLTSRIEVNHISVLPVLSVLSRCPEQAEVLNSAIDICAPSTTNNICQRSGVEDINIIPPTYQSSQEPPEPVMKGDGLRAEKEFVDITNILLVDDLKTEDLSKAEIETEKVSEITVGDECSLPEYLRLLKTGADIDGDSKVSLDSMPNWLNMDKFRRGQKFATEYFFGLVFAEMLSLMMLFSYPENVQPLIFSGNSDTPFKAFKRYLSTVVRVKSWYEGNPWQEGDEARRNLKAVRIMHESYRSRLNKADPKEISKKITLRSGPLWSDLTHKIQDDFRSSCPYPTTAQCPYKSKRGTLFINQMDMATTQFGFVGLMVLYPSSFGAAGASEEDLEGFVHLWRGIGYLLGIDDRYNFCAGDLATVRQRTQDIIQHWVRPNLRNVTREWEHMLRCVVEGISYYVPGLTFEVSLLYLCRLLGLHTPRLRAALSYWQGFMYRVMSLVMCYLLRIPAYRTFSNWLLKMSIKRSLAASPSWLRGHEERVYPYQKHNGIVCTRL